MTFGWYGRSLLSGALSLMTGRARFITSVSNKRQRDGKGVSPGLPTRSKGPLVVKLPIGGFLIPGGFMPKRKERRTTADAGSHNGKDETAITKRVFTAHTNMVTTFHPVLDPAGPKLNIPSTRRNNDHGGKIDRGRPCEIWVCD